MAEVAGNGAGSCQGGVVHAPVLVKLFGIQARDEVVHKDDHFVAWLEIQARVR